MRFEVSLIKRNKTTQLINVDNKIQIINTVKDKINDLKFRFNIHKEIQGLKDKWLQIMANCSIYNSEFKTFTLTDIMVESYGYSCKIYVPYGLTFSKLDALKTTIEDSMPCMFIFTEEKCKNYINAKFITNGFSVGDYHPIRVNPWEVYIGNGADGRPIVISMLEFPHILLSGTNNSGKTKCLDCILTSLIHYCSSKELELYLIQVAKSDLIIYEDAEQTKAFADTLKKAAETLDYVLKEMQKRDKLIRPLKKSGKGSNIKDYNELNPDNKLSYCYVAFDEMSSLFDVAGNDKGTIALKKGIINKLEQIWQYGRALGVYGIACTQRPTADKLSPYVKSQSNLMISFKQNNSKSSEVAINDPNIALHLAQRVAVYLTMDYGYMKTPFITDKMIIKYIQNKLCPNHETIFNIEEPKQIENTSKNTSQDNKPAGKESNKEIPKTSKNGGKVKC